MKLLKAFILVFLFSGCLTGPDDSRSNPNDPKSPSFIADFSPPQVRTSPNNKALNVGWTSRSQYGEGFIVEKKLSDTYVALDTLIKTSFYIDSSKEYSLDLMYRITSFLTNDKGELTNKFSQETKAIDFGDISNSTAFANGDSISVQWFSEFMFDDITTIEMRENSTSSWNEIYRNENADGDFHRVTFGLPVENSYDFKISLFIINHDSKPEKFHEKIISYSN
ncbi:MAG: hypothetical protein WD016_08715 [Balneolaceae bacterium]